MAQINEMHRQGVILALCAATGFACKAIFVKLAYSHGVDALTLLAMRMVFAIIFFALLPLLTFRQRPKGERLTLADWGWVILLGIIGYYLSSLLDFLGLRFVSASVERLILMLGPTFTLILSALIFRQRITLRMVIPIVISYTGTGLILGQDISHPGPDFWLGVALVLGSTLCYSVYLTFSPVAIKRIGSMRFSEIVTIVSGLLVLLHYFIAIPSIRVSWPWQVWVYGAAMGLFSTVLPIYALATAISRIGAARTALISMIGPVITIFMGISILNEHLTTLQWLGAMLVILGVWMVSRAKS